MASPNLQRWYDHMQSHDHQELRDMLADDVVFHSPVVHTPQRGKEITFQYLASAEKVLGGEDFVYVREFDLGDRAVLEFETKIDGIYIDGIDMISWNEAGQITDFKVMVRPLQAINMLHAKMKEMLERLKAQ
ncbi:nuclear transport factor 2 family protein [Ponticaulis sp.]|jgi:ketosteroid isomerase-like protein|uniref:nuclear transport factor 2 family protein n=1 Tax=Ponticaulis sp. TaxID=2020902 RepID=UPI000B733EE8|nr:nuclear transport factor 2 family protein [Ponticaulis sp.]RPG18105.1 MAG: nuclear transport factor 2 family protein [Hyphomonadaceae bacterium TMED125]HBH89527.1 hypothetical protein [Hyphomonadaceae bacterium]MAJ07784.1 hypothetical protein [Ponticaulis sp.]MBN02886.1 hypothetical protein [Ponticaulis sp.]MDF1679563.1 nuclear transport factor 2 family protein [Ponticaulis sp.]|tara:strand:- start:80 stop:475 length:396 start_codon:yes stop_codon:yes gene_type:complete